MLMLAAVLAAGAAMAAPPRVEERHARLCPTVEVRRAGALRPPRKPIFSVRQVGDLEFVLRYRSRPARRVELKLYTPRGHLYQTLSEAIGPQADRAPGRVSLRWPVSGTLVEQGALFGSWSLEPVLDGAASTCPRATPFTLTR
jgi:hypothetical protein